MADPKKKKPFPPKKEDPEAEEPEEEDPEEADPEAEKGFPQKKKKGFPPRKSEPGDCNAEFSRRVNERIKKHVTEGLDEDAAAVLSFKEVKEEMTRGDSIARMTREGMYPYWESGEWKNKRKKFEELKKAVDRLEGRPLPAYPHHEDADDITKCIGLYHNIVADETTRSVYGELLPSHEKGEMNSIGFRCNDKLAADGVEDQVDIDLNHVAVDPTLVGRGGETVAVIDMADPDMKKQLDEATAAVKAKGDEIAALDAKIKESDSKIKAKDAEIEILKAKSASVGDEVKLLKERLDAITKAAELKEKSEVIASILDPKRRLGDERTKAIKATLDSLDLAGVKALKVQADIFAPITNDAVDKHEGLFPPTGDKSPALDDMFKDERHEYHGNKM